MSDPTLEDLFADLVRAKQAEKDANAKRIACEEAILDRIESKPEKGRVRLEGGPVTATVKFELSYSADVDAISQLDLGAGAAQLPLKTRPATREFDERAYEELRESAPDVFAKVSKFVTTKPKKPAFELKL